METFATTDILNQVNRICQYPEIRSKRILCSFLRFIVEETLAGRGDQLKGYVIGTQVLGKDVDFDPEQDSLVRIHAGRLRRLLRIYYLDVGKDDHVHIEIPKGCYKPLFSSNGESKKVSRSDNSRDTTPIPREPSVAVLPFKNLTGNPDKEYFSYGFSEELSIELTKYDDLNIINCWRRPESENGKGLYGDLGARYLIDGSVQAYDQNVHILVKLVEAYSGKQIWAERYTRNLSVKSLVDIQEDIADTVAKTIGSEVGVVLGELSAESNRIVPEHMEVFDAVLQFYYYEARMSESLGSIVYQKLQQALSNDPASGVIHAMMASMHGTAFALDYPGNDHFGKMTELIDDAMRLDPDNLIVRIVNSFRFFLNNEKDRFLQEAKRCLSMNIVSPLRLGILGFHLSLFGFWEEGKAILDRAMNKSTGYPLFLHGAICLYYFRLGKYSEALKEAEKYDMPGLFWGPLLRTACLGKLGKREKASAHNEQLLVLKPDFEAKARDLVSRYVKEDDLLSDILDGLKKGGLKIRSIPTPLFNS